MEQDFRRNFLVFFTLFLPFFWQYGFNTVITPLETSDVKRGKCPGDEVDIIAKKDWELEETKHPRWRPRIHGEFEQFASNFLLLGN